MQHWAHGSTEAGGGSGAWLSWPVAWPCWSLPALGPLLKAGDRCLSVLRP